MQINTAPASDGVRWVTEAFKLFLKQPLGLPAMAVIYFFMHLPVVIPGVGGVIAAVLSPFATLGLMSACREIAAGRMPSPALYLKPFQDATHRRALLRLGAANAVLTLFVVMLTLLLGVAETMLTTDAAPTATDVRWDNFAWLLLLYAPVIVLMWFAPMLAGWHDAGPAKAMFGSVIACWRNKSAMLMFALAISVVVITVAMLIGALLGALGSSNEMASILIGPAALVLLGVVQASVYVMYTTIFGKET
jgi:hypothetical protein